MEKYQVAIVIPAFNEEATIANVVQSVGEYGVVIVVNDASTDKTEKNAKDAGAIIVNHKYNKGYDSALNSGFIKANKLKCDAVITFDADGQHNSKLLILYIEYLKNGVDLVLGVRPNSARFSEYLFSLYTRVRFGWVDPLCGMKGYNMKIYQKQGYFDSYKSIGTELAIFTFLNNYSHIQLPITILQREGSSRFSPTSTGDLRIIKALIRSIISK